MCQNEVYERNLCTLFHVLPFAFLLLAFLQRNVVFNLFLLLFKCLILLNLAHPTVMSQIEQTKRYDEEYGNDTYHIKKPVQLRHFCIKLFGTCLKLSVLTCLLLQVKVDVAMIVAQFLVVNSCINDTQLLVNAGNQIGSLTDGGIGQGKF